MELLSDILYLLVAGPVALFATFTQIWAGGFFTNLVAPITVDESPEWHHPPRIESSPLLNNLLLLMIFPVQHSAMPRGLVKRILSCFVPERYYRPFYNLSASLVLTLLFYCWQPMPTVVWNIPQPAVWYFVLGLDLLCLLAVVTALLSLDLLELLGLRYPIMRLMGWSAPKLKLIDTGVFGLVRHPVYSALMIAIWITPTMTVGHLLISSVFTAYIMIAVAYYEEPDLVKTFGPVYVEYMKRTPRYIPWPGSGQSSKKE